MQPQRRSRSNHVNNFVFHIMKKIFVGALLLGWAFVAAAQSAPSHENRFYVSVQGADVLNLYENAFTYRDNGADLDLFTFQGGLGLGYNFSEAFGLRTQLAYGYDRGAANSLQTSAGGFYPYGFKHANLFVDAVLNLSGLNGEPSAFRPKVYAGAGCAYTFGFSDPGHPWQTVSGSNFAPGFRLGFIAEYTLSSGFGFFADLGGEFYGDTYNGLRPSSGDQQAFTGYAGFPFDLRGLFSLGIMYLF